MFNKDIAAIKMKIGSVARKHYMGKMISNRVLIPLLDKLDKEIEKVTHEIGMKIEQHLKSTIINSQPSGSTYQIVQQVGDGDSKEFIVLGTYQASSPGQPPASEAQTDTSKTGLPTGTLIQSIRYEVTEDGRLQIGIWDSNASTEFESLYYTSRIPEASKAEGIRGRIVVGDTGHKGDVDTYANVLDTGSSKIEPRPWFTDVINKMRPELRKMIKEALTTARDKYSRSETKKAVYFRLYVNELRGRSNFIGSFNDRGKNYAGNR